jgi:hypothetical protein
MKKLILTPQKDTLTLCLPHDWVGKPLMCILHHPNEKGAFPVDSEFVSELRDDAIGYHAHHYRMKGKPRRKRLRRTRGGVNKLL